MGKNMNIKDLIKDRTVTFSYYRAGFLHYTIDGVEFEFVVPIEDCGEASFNAQDKAIVFMRYIRKQLELIKEIASEPMVTYVHENAPNGQRFRQYKKDKLPIWAVDVQEEKA